jgi:hypothetical protein
MKIMPISFSGFQNRKLRRLKTPFRYAQLHIMAINYVTRKHFIYNTILLYSTAHTIWVDRDNLQSYCSCIKIISTSNSCSLSSFLDCHNMKLCISKRCLQPIYANILKYHIQGMPTNILVQVFTGVYITVNDNYR